MYHPDSMLRIAHQREAELVREAQICGMPKAEPKRATIAAELVATVVTGTILATALIMPVW